MNRAFLLTAILALLGCSKPIEESKTAPQRVPTSYPAQESRWKAATINTVDVGRIDKAIAVFLRNQARYTSIEKMRTNGVPAPVIFTLHNRESDASFRCHLHNGDSLLRRTVNVPAGRIPGKNPPYTFEESAEDALYVVDHLDRKNWISLGDGLQAIEGYNGPGYAKYHPSIPTPYLWAGTSLYTRGKYVSDGRFSETAVDKQLGCAAILKRMKERGISFWPALEITDLSTRREERVALTVWLRARVEF